MLKEKKYFYLTLTERSLSGRHYMTGQKNSWIGSKKPADGVFILQIIPQKAEKIMWKNLRRGALPQKKAQFNDRNRNAACLYMKETL